VDFCDFFTFRDQFFVFRVIQDTKREFQSKPMLEKKERREKRKEIRKARYAGSIPAVTEDVFLRMVLRILTISSFSVNSGSILALFRTSSASITRSQS
jgi:hypothetical protein